MEALYITQLQIQALQTRISNPQFQIMIPNRNYKSVDDNSWWQFMMTIDDDNWWWDPGRSSVFRVPAPRADA